MRFADLKEKVERMKKANRISLTAFATYNENNRLVDSYILDVENAKFLVTKTDTEIGDAYTRHLIQCEKKLDQFVSPSPRSELNGELGLDLHEIAKTMELDFSKVKRKFLELEKVNEIIGVQIGVRQNQGLTLEREVETFVLDLDNAKLLVTQLGGKLSIAYCKHLIQCEKKLDQTTLLINGMMADETICRRVLQLADEKQNALIAERDHAIETKAHINGTQMASGYGIASAAKSLKG